MTVTLLGTGCPRFDGDGRSLAISGDTRPCENLVRHTRNVDLLVHECTDATMAQWTRPAAAGPPARLLSRFAGIANRD